MRRVDLFAGDTPPQNLIPTTNIEPVHADVRFRVEFGTAGADDLLHGVMDLDVQVLQPNVAVLKLHQFRLQFTACSVFSGGRTCKCDSWTLDAENQQVVFRFSAPFELGLATFHMAWTVNVSRLPDPKPGEKYWKGIFVQHYGPRSFHCITQFEPCNARSAYPCFDQPCTKQTFRLTLSNVPAELTTLSNTEIETEVAEADQTKTVTFRQTAPTPAYLTAWVIGVFDRLERTLSLPDFEGTGGKTVALDVRVFVPRELAAQGYEGGYGLELVCKAVSFFTHEFRVNYPYGKLDNVSTPLHPLLGMENWGLITYSAGFLDVKPGSLTQDRRKRIARLVAHEVVHQWFGNSTTVGWWSALYLKEGFARLLEYVFVDRSFPEWHYFDHFQSDIYASVLGLDERLERTHPVQHRIDVPAQIYSNVDLITYAKGACVLRQLWSFLGAETFFAALQLYLRRHRNDCVMPAQLWQAMTDATNGSVDVAALMDCWVTKRGHPFIRAWMENGAVVLEQYLCEATVRVGAPFDDGSDTCIARDEEGRSLFAIPVVARSLGAAGTTHKFVLARGRMRCPELDGGAFSVLNVDACGFYRVQYDEAMLLLLLRNVSAVRDIELCAILVDTLFFFARPGEQPGYRRPSSQTLMTLVLTGLGRIRSHYLWQLLLPALLELLRHVQLCDSFGHVASALREPLNRFFESLRGDNAEFAERGHLPLLEDVLCLVCSPLDSFGLALSGGCDDSFFRLAREASLFAGSAPGPEVAALLRPVELSCRSPVMGETAARQALAMAFDPATHPRLRLLLERLVAQSPHAAPVAELAEQAPDLAALLARHPDAPVLARAAVAVCAARGLPPPPAAAEALARYAAGEDIRRAFSLFSWRRGSLSRLSSSQLTPRESSFAAPSARPKAGERYVPWTQYALLGAVALGAVALGVTGWMLFKPAKQLPE